MDVTNERDAVHEVGVGGYCQFPHLAIGADDEMLMAWVSDRIERDERGYPLRFGNEVYVRDGQRWPSPVKVVSEGGCCYKPVVTFDSSGAAWVFWSAYHCGSAGHIGWRVEAKRRTSDGWSERIIVSQKSNIEYRCSAASDANGNIFVVYESFRRGKFDIYLRRLSNSGEPAEEALISDNADNNYRPAVAVDASGAVWVAWEWCHDGRYDVLARRVAEGKLGGVVPLTHRGDFNGAVALAADAVEPLVWAVFHSVNGRENRIEARCLREDGCFVPQGADEFPRGVVAEGNLAPSAAVDGSGRLWVVFAVHQGCRECALFARSYRGGEWSNITRLTTPIPNLYRPTVKRQDRDASIAIDSKGRVWCLYVSWVPMQTHCGLKLRCLEAVEGGDYIAPQLHPAEVGEPERAQIVPPPSERYSVELDGETYSVYWGDLHGHTELSYDGNGQVDEWFMLGRERVGLDFLALTDHDRTLAEHFLARTIVSVANELNRFVTINGYEVVFDLPAIGDKCVLEFEEDAPFYWTWLHVGDVFVPRGRFHEAFKGRKILIISHDGSWTNGICETDAQNEELSPVVQVSTTHSGQVPDEFERYREGVSRRGEDYIRLEDLLKRGFRYGIVGGSDDHRRHPQVRTALYLRELTRDEIYEALKARRCYAVTMSRIVLDFRVDGNFMGSIVRSSGASPRRVFVHAEAPEPIAAIDIVKNCRTVHSRSCSSRSETIEWTDDSLTSGGCDFYYARVRLENGHLAWSSPVWFEG